MRPEAIAAGRCLLRDRPARESLFFDRLDAAENSRHCIPNIISFNRMELPPMATIGSLRADLSASSAVAGTESSACGVLMAEGGRRCKLTGHTGFAGAMERILADPSVSAGVEKIAVSRPVSRLPESNIALAKG